MPELCHDKFTTLPVAGEVVIGSVGFDALPGVEMRLDGHYLGKPCGQTEQRISALPAIDCRAAR